MLLATASAAAVPARALEDYSKPTLSEIMTITQLRHFKLSYAGRATNWELAEYELGKMRRAFDAAAQLYPVFKSVEQAKLIDSTTKPALESIEKAIQQKDRPAFKRAFRSLTDACNACHKAAGLAFIVIRVPTSSPFSDQAIVPVRP
ncbi:MAG: hypothetical protein U1E46_00995 [Hyphomicrobiales bacterium]